jgi:serine/threonine protein kinase
MECIGKGTYGTVYRAKDRATGRTHALKRIILHNEKSDGFPVTSMREIRVLRAMRGHRNIVELCDVVVGEGRDDVFLVFEYCEHDMSTLMHHFVRNRSEPNSKMFTAGALKRLMLGLAAGVAHLHARTIIHRDLKMANLLYTSRGTIKIADFGMARWVPQPVSRANLSPKVMTLWYRAPEMLLGASTYGRAVDIWSLGCIFAELWHGKPLLQGKTDTEQIALMFKTLGAPNEASWPGLARLPARKAGVIAFAPETPQVPYELAFRLGGGSAGAGAGTAAPSSSKSADSTFPPPLMPMTSAVGLDLLKGLLNFDPTGRLPASAIVEHAFFAARPLPLAEQLMPTFPSSHKVRRDDTNNRRAKGRKGQKKKKKKYGTGTEK